MLCSCLAPLEREILNSGAKETSRGQAWSKNCREWVYFDLVFDTEALTSRVSFPPSVTTHENTDPRSGLERGLVCTEHHDAIMGRISGAPRYG